MTTVLEASGVSCGYGAVDVIHDINLAVASGEIVALLGPNGAGKTTTLMALAGELPLTAGTVSLTGAPVTGPMHRRARRGLAYVTDDRSVFMNLTVQENLAVGRVDPAECLELFPALGKRIGIKAGSLSGGEQQMLTLGRALSRHPKVIIADELSLGLAPLVTERLLQALRRAADEAQVGVLLVEQHLDAILRYADRAYVMQRGQLVIQGAVADLRTQLSAIEKSYLGG